VEHHEREELSQLYPLVIYGISPNFEVSE
jgi:hypothetical protein